MGITATGLGTGLDVEGIVSSLVLADIQPAEQRLNANETKFQAQLSAYGSVKGALSVFQTAANTVGTAANYQKKAASTSLFSDVEVSAKGGAAVGTYDIAVSALAGAHSLASSAFTTTSDVVGTGTLSIELGTTAYNSSTDAYSSFTRKTGTSAVSITIDSSNNTLAGVRDAINASTTAGIKASIVNDGAGYRLVLTSSSSGADNSIALSVTDTGDSNNTDANGLSRLSFNSSSTNLSQTKAASDAALTINGLAVTSASNEVTTAIDDVTLTLKKVTTAPVTVSVTEDTAAAKADIVSFVAAYNDVIGTLNQLTKYDATTASGSLMTGDSTIRTLASNIRGLVNAQVANVGGGYSSMAELGLTTVVTDGKLQIDNVKLDAALKAEPLDVANVFAAIGRPTNSNVRFVSSTTNTESGSYAVAATVTNTAGVYTAGSAVTDSTYNGNGNDVTFSVTVDGGSTQNVTLNRNLSNAEGVRADIAGKLTGVTVTLDASDKLVFTSNTSGTASSIAISGIDGSEGTQLGLSNASGAAGTTSTAYTINGAAAVADATGNVITGAAGTAVDGLSLKILGGASGDLGSVSFGIGVGAQLNTLIKTLLETDGLLDARVTGLNTSVADVTKQRTALEAKALALEARYRSQFNGLETIISSLTATQSFLTTALSQFVDPLAFKK